MTALLLLGPATPLLFQGQEFWASAPFLFFADHQPELARLVAAGRKEFLTRFRSIASAESSLPAPEREETFLRCKLDFSEREANAAIYKMHRELLELRRKDPVFSRPRPGGVDGAVLGPEAFVLRFFGENKDDRLLVINLGLDLHLNPAPEPLLARVEGCEWALKWSSEDPRYGGCGTPSMESEVGWQVPGHAAVVLAPKPANSGPPRE